MARPPAASERRAAADGVRAAQPPARLFGFPPSRSKPADADAGPDVCRETRRGGGGGLCDPLFYKGPDCSPGGSVRIAAEGREVEMKVVGAATTPNLFTRCGRRSMLEEAGELRCFLCCRFASPADPEHAGPDQPGC